MAREFDPGVFRGTRAYREFVKKYGSSERCVACYEGVAMGEANACTYAMGAHSRILEEGGSYPPHVQVLGGRPFPSGQVVELLVIDDHVGIAADPPGAGRNRRQLEASFGDARRSYVKAGLDWSHKKARRGAREAVVVGAEVLGDEAWVAAPRLRRGLQARAGMWAAKGSVMT